MPRLNLPKERTFEGPASVWKRVGAFFIDMVILNFFVFFPFRELFTSIVPGTSTFSEAYSIFSSSNDYSKDLTLISFFMSVLMIMYFYILEKKTGQTVGKHLFHLYVVSDANSMKGWQALVRSIAFIPVFPFILLWLADPLLMLFNKDNLRLSEILSKTRVIEKYNLEGWQ